MVAAFRETLADHHGDIRAQLARDNLIVFTRRMFPQYRAARHHWQVAHALQAVERGDIDRLVITMPPRHGKSELASVHFPAWFLGCNPERRIIAASYSAGLAFRFSRRARNLMAQPRWPFAVTTAGDLANVQSWDIAGHRGGYIAAGVGGGITGHGADLLLIDDPVKSADEADSETIRESTWEWFTQDAMTRLEPGGRIALIGTRWHEDDLIGRALASATHWEHVDFPAINEAGDALWPERFPLAALVTRKQEIGSRAFEALYQQRPAPAEGALLKREWWTHWQQPLPQPEWIVQSWDTAFKTGAENDYSVCLTAALAGNAIYVLDVWRNRVEFPELKRVVRNQFARFQPDEIVVEDAGSGQSLIQEFGRDPDPFAVFREPILPLVPFKPDRDKLARVNAVTPFVESGHVSLPAHAHWTDDFTTECASFPTGKYDDQVDALSMALLRIKDRMGMLRGVDPYMAAAFVGLPG